MSKTNDSSVQLADVPEFSVATLIESIPDGIVVAEYESGKIVGANDAAGELFDCQPSDLVGRSHLELHPAEDEEQYREAFRRGFESETIERLDDGGLLYIETLDGERKPVEINAQRIQSGRKTHVLGVFREISRRIERERQLEETTRRLNTLVDATPLPVAVLDTSGCVQLWNQAAQDTFGYEPDEIIEERYPLFVDDTELDAVLTKICDGSILDGYETVHRARDGSRAQVELYARPLYDDGVVTGVIGAAIDVTSQKRRRERLDVLHRLLRHDLRNKLVVIEGYASMLADEPETGGPTNAEAAEKIVAATAELTTLSNHATQVRKVVNANKTDVVGLPALLDTLRDVKQVLPATSLDAPSATYDVEIPAKADSAVSWLLTQVAQYVDEPGIDLRIEVCDRFVRVDIRGDSPLLSKGDAELITNGKETALKHGSDLDIARAYMTISSLGGDIIQIDNTLPEQSFRFEIPRTDTVGDSV